MQENNITPTQDEIVLYQSEDGNVKVDVLFQGETVWLTQEQMALLFGKARSTINEHIQNIYQEGELQESNSMRKFGNSEFSMKPTNYYNLDVIISVGYRVKSRQGTMFRIWATQRLHEDELQALKLIVEQYLAYAEAQALAHRPMYMKDWKERLDVILKLNERNVLEGPGKISHELAKQKAETEYLKYKELEKEQIHLESIKELDKDIKQLKGK